MNSVVQTQGIQALLAAEKSAEETISKARQTKTRRLKQARDEADQEIKQFQAQKDAQFREYVKQHSGNNDQLSQKLKDDTNRQLKEIDQLVAANSAKVADFLTSAVFDVTPKKHVNLKV
eukprot:Nk52_evm11s485 gene=Nk52_evmTU11s485